jgi:hypothetical protein
MTLASVINEENFGKLDPVIQKEYKPLEGRHGYYILDAASTTLKTADGTSEQVFSLEDVRGLRDALEKSNANFHTTEARLRGFKDLDPDKAREALRRIEEMKSWKPGEEVERQIAAKVSEVQNKYDDDSAAWSAERDSLEEVINQMLIDGEVARILGEESLRGSAILLTPQVRARTRVVKEEIDGKPKRRLEVLNDAGQVALTKKQGKTNSMELRELLELMRDGHFGADIARGFYGSDKRGSGAEGGEYSASGLRKLTEEEAMNPTKYREMKELAEKEGKDIRDYMPESSPTATE